MPSFALKQKMLQPHSTNGEWRKANTDFIEDASWWEDVDSRVVYLYDYYHDKYRNKLNNLNPVDDDDKVAIDAKFINHTTQTYDKDQITYWLQLRPGQKCNVPYFAHDYEERYGNIMWPIGMYVDVPDANGVFNKWLVVDKANINDVQFPTFELLRCDKVIQYIQGGVKRQISGILRTQNSYNSGIYQENKIEIAEDVQKFTIPLNRDTEQIYYNQRMILDARVLSEPRAWKVSKINRTNPEGIVRVTMAQDKFNPSRDYLELDNDGNVVGMWADYYLDGITPVDENQETPAPIPQTEISIACSGVKPEIKVGGSYKKLTLSFVPDLFVYGRWSFSIDGADANDLVNILTTDDLSVIKIKFGGGNQYLGKVLTAKYLADDGSEGSLQLAITAL